MNELKQLKKKYFKHFLTFLIMTIICFGSAIGSAFLPIDDNWKYLLIFFFLIVIIVYAGLNKNKLMAYNNALFIARLRDNPGEPVNLTQDVLSDVWKKSLKEKGFTKSHETPKYEIFYKIIKDNIKKPTFTKIMQVVVIVDKKQNDFYLKEVEDEINKILDINQKKEKINKLLICQFKEIFEADNTIKEKIKEIVFLRFNGSITSTLNVAINKKYKVGLFLNSPYSPSLYYKMQKELIISLL